MDNNYGTTICEHIRTFYSTVTEEPIVYWPFDSSMLAAKSNIVNRESITGDVCHYDIENLSHKQAKEIFRDHASNDNLFICNPDDGEPFTIEKLRSLLN